MAFASTGYVTICTFLYVLVVGILFEGATIQELGFNSAVGLSRGAALCVRLS